MVRSLIDVDEQLKVYRKYKDKIFQNDGKAHQTKNEIYQTLTSELVGMTPKAIQTSINRKRAAILVRFFYIFVISSYTLCMMT